MRPKTRDTLRIGALLKCKKIKLEVTSKEAREILDALDKTRVEEAYKKGYIDGALSKGGNE